MKRMYTIGDIRYIQEHMNDGSASIAAALNAPQKTIIEYIHRMRRGALSLEGYRFVKYYALYLRKTDELVCSGTAQECADALGIRKHSFYVLVHKALHGKVKKWDVYVEDVDVEESEYYDF